MSEECPQAGALVDVELARIATQYREAERLRGYMAAVLAQVEDIARATCAIPDYFDILTARGEQLTFVGKRMGFPRCHCVCNTRPVIGFACEDSPSIFPIVGFCDDGAWLGCEGTADLCIGDDEVYRALLLSRRYQILGLFDIESLGAALRHVWGPTAWIPRAERGKVVVAPGRDLTASEMQRLQVTLRALPIAPGIGIALHYGTARIAGFGDGWFGFCADVPTQPVFGFECDEPAPNQRPITGFCDASGVWVNCAPPVTSEGYWLCPVDIDPYACS